MANDMATMFVVEDWNGAEVVECKIESLRVPQFVAGPIYRFSKESAIDAYIFQKEQELHVLTADFERAKRRITARIEEAERLKVKEPK